MESSTPRSRRAVERLPAGWALFAGLVILAVGSLTALWGLGAVLNDDVVLVGGKGVLLGEIATWGWVCSDLPRFV